MTCSGRALAGPVGTLVLHAWGAVAKATRLRLVFEAFLCVHVERPAQRHLILDVLDCSIAELEPVPQLSVVAA